MFCTVLSACLAGMEAKQVTVEVDVSDGMPCISMVGNPSAQVREAGDRVRTALRNAGLHLPVKRITINLAPADLRKEGSGLDLPIALGMLCGYGYVSPASLEGIMFIGELGLDGSLSPVKGILEMVSKARQFGAKTCIIPESNLEEGSLISDVNVYGGSSLMQIMNYLNGSGALASVVVDAQALLDQGIKDSQEDFSCLRGQLQLRRAAQIAAAGMHNLLLIGPPGSGKTLTARCLPSILPRLTLEEALDITRIHSIAGLLGPGGGLITQRPFRSPHHTVTTAALAGGGRHPVPGEISLAHRGVLFLDELPEFSSRTLEVLRQPLEEHRVVISRTTGTYLFPANFILIAAMNPCKCGYYPDRTRCRCSVADVRRYLDNISQPLLDRFDLCAEAAEVPYEDLASASPSESSAGLLEAVARADLLQQERYEGTPFLHNGDLSGEAVYRYCPLGPEQNRLMKRIFESYHLTGRSFVRILKVARTIADLAGSSDILTEHLAEAISFRTMDKKYWGA